MDRGFDSEGILLVTETVDWTPTTNSRERLSRVLIRRDEVAPLTVDVRLGHGICRTIIVSYMP